MNRFASISLAWLSLFAAAFAGDRDAWFAVTRHTTWQHTKVTTKDGRFLTVRAFSETRLVFPAAAARHVPRAGNGGRKAPSSPASCVLRSSVFSITARYAYGPFGEPLSANSFFHWLTCTECSSFSSAIMLTVSPRGPPPWRRGL